MAQPTGSYDESLLRDAPVATRKQLQEGYTTDLLSKPRSLNRAQSPLPDGATAAIPPTPLHADLEQGQRSQDGFNHYAPLNKKVIPSSKTPFLRTTKGIILIVVLAIIIVGAVVGAAVGTTVNKNKSQSATNNSMVTTSPTSTSVPTGSSSNGAGEGGSGPAVGSSSSATPTSFTFPPIKPSNNPINGNDILQSESNVVAAMKQAGHYKRRDASQASGNIDVP